MNQLSCSNVYNSLLKASYSARPDLKVTNLIVGVGENMSGVKSNSMDLVVHTFILCSVDDAKQVLSEICRVLKPGGVCVFVEHSLSNSLLLRFFHKFIGPLWYICLDCRFKNMRQILGQSKYDSITIRETGIKNPLLFPVNPIVYGFGKKNV